MSGAFRHPTAAAARTEPAAFAGERHEPIVAARMAMEPREPGSRRPHVRNSRNWFHESRQAFSFPQGGRLRAEGLKVIPNDRVQDALNRIARLIGCARAPHALSRGAERASASRAATGANRAIAGSPWQFLQPQPSNRRGNTCDPRSSTAPHSTQRVLTAARSSHVNASTARIYSSTFLASTSSGTLPPSTTVSLNAFRSNFASERRLRLLALPVDLAVPDLVAARLAGPRAIAVDFARHFLRVRSVHVDEELHALLARPALGVDAGVDDQPAGAEGDRLQIAEPPDADRCHTRRVRRRAARHRAPTLPSRR